MHTYTSVSIRARTRVHIFPLKPIEIDGKWNERQGKDAKYVSMQWLWCMKCNAQIEHISNANLNRMSKGKKRETKGESRHNNFRHLIRFNISNYFDAYSFHQCIAYILHTHIHSHNIIIHCLQWQWFLWPSMTIIVWNRTRTNANMNKAA